LIAPLFPPRVVIDTNVLLDFWVFDDPRARQLREALESGRIQGLRDGATVDELAEVLSRPRFGLEAVRQMALLREWDRLAVAEPAAAGASPLRCADPLDQKFLDLAAAARADWLVSKDKALLKLARKARPLGLAILLPEAAGALVAP
jgi:putative PIN family toxin of toxin-antitoxin system